MINNSSQRCLSGGTVNPVYIWDDLEVACEDERSSNKGGWTVISFVQGAHLRRDNYSLFAALGGGFFSIYIFKTTSVSAANSS